jgi:hypothetical protein
MKEGVVPRCPRELPSLPTRATRGQGGIADQGVQRGDYFILVLAGLDNTRDFVYVRPVGSVHLLVLLEVDLGSYYSQHS